MSDDTEKIGVQAESSESGGAEAAQAAAGDAGKENFQLPKVDFATFVLSLASSALVQLGEVPNPETGKSGQNLPIAKHTIDILTMLREKTSCGLTEEEARLMDGILYELRMKYVIKAG